MKNLFRLLIDIILPPRCLCCGKIISSDNKLCSECFKKITFITSPFCSKCGKPLNTNLDDVYDCMCVDCLNKKTLFRYCRSAILYDDFSKKIILDFKFHDHIENKKLLVQWLYLAGQDIFNMGIDVIIPVPLHYMRLFKRKYNQSAILARELSKACNIPVDYTSLKKIRYTIPQVNCNQKQRKNNIKNAFQVCNVQNIKDKRILLIDDVYTTGATLQECAKVLLKAGAKSVDALTVARV